MTRSSPYRAVNTLRLGYKKQLMLYREIIAVCSQIHTKHTNTAVWAERRIFFFFLARFHINNEKLPAASSCLACRLSACIIAAVTGRIFVKLDPVDLYESLAMNSTYFANMATILGTLH